MAAQNTNAQAQTARNPATHLLSFQTFSSRPMSAPKSSIMSTNC